MIDAWLGGIGTAIGTNIWLAPLLALFAGILTSFTPCALSSIPLVIAFVGGTNADPKSAFRLSLTFAAGAAVAFTALGAAASMMGKLIGTGASWWYIVLGVLMMLMALQTWGIFNFIPSTFLLNKNKKRGYFGAFLAGILGGIFSSPCATPALVALLAVAAGQDSMVWGILLLLLYGVGHGVLTVVAGSSLGFVQKLTQNPRYGRLSKVLKIALGILILFIGFYMFYLGL